MVPTFLSRILESLPGRPAAHMKGIIVFVIAVQLIVAAAQNVTGTGSNTMLAMLFIPGMLLAGIIIVLATRGSYLLGGREIIDLRDWLLVRGISTALFLTFALWVIAGGMADGFQWHDTLLYVGAPLVIWPEFSTFLNILARSEELPDWQTTILIKRREAENDI